MKVNTYFLAAAMSFGVAGAQAAPMLTNGDFENIQIGIPYQSLNTADIPGWTHTGFSGDGLIWNIGFGSGATIKAGHGNQFVTLGGGCCDDTAANSAAWTTTVTGLLANQIYTLDFLIAAEGYDSSLQTLTVAFLSGSSTISKAFTSLAPSGAFWRTWSAQTMDFVADSGTVNIEFSVTNQAFDMGLDCVGVRGSNGVGGCSVPEPSSLALLGFGLAGLRFGRRKRAQSHGPLRDGFSGCLQCFQ